jgi:hypothetical protein
MRDFGARRGAALFLLAAAAGCGGGATGGAAPADAALAPRTAEAERGPVHVALRAEPGTIDAGAKLRLSIDVTAPAGVDIRMPEIGETLGSFAVRDAAAPPDVPDGGGRRWTHAYVLDTFEDGALEIPALTVAFTDARDAAAAPVIGEVAVGPLAIDVRPVAAPDEEARAIRDAVELPAPAGAGPWRIALLGAGAALVLAVIIVFIMRRRGRALPAPLPEPADVRALRELDALAASDLLAAGRWREFYFRLSDVVRAYVERRFAIRAPERTTAEFLAEARRSPALSSPHRDLLAGFLRAADLVKFARHEPKPGEGEAALAAARRFVEETRAVDAPREAPSGGPREGPHRAAGAPAITEAAP